MKLEFRHFELVEAINKGGSLATAAKLLGKTQPAVSIALKALEKEVGGKLFEFSPNGLIPTPLADIFLTRHMALKGPLDQIYADLKSLAYGRFGHINIGTGFNPPLISLYPALSQLQKELPSLSVNLLERDWRDIMVAIASETIDLGIIDVSIAEQSSEFDFRRLPRHDCCVVVRSQHPLAGKAGLTIEDLLPYSYCGPHPSRWAIDQSGIGSKIFGIAEGDTEQISASFNAHTFFTALNMILSTNAFSVFPKIIFEHMSPIYSYLDFSTQLVNLEISELSWLKTNYGLVWNKNRLTLDCLKRFIEIIVKMENDLLRSNV